VARAAEAWAVVVKVVTAAQFWVEARQPRTSAAAAIVARPTDPNGPMTARGRWTFGRPGTLTSTLGSLHTEASVKGADKSWCERHTGGVCTLR
jgi:hypothetical protein